MYLRCSELSGEGLKDPDAHAIARLSALLRLAGLLELQGRRGDAAAAYSIALQREAELIHRSQVNCYAKNYTTKENNYKKHQPRR